MIFPCKSTHEKNIWPYYDYFNAYVCSLLFHSSDGRKIFNLLQIDVLSGNLF